MRECCFEQVDVGNDGVWRGNDRGEAVECIAVSFASPFMHVLVVPVDDRERVKCCGAWHTHVPAFSASLVAISDIERRASRHLKLLLLRCIKSNRLTLRYGNSATARTRFKPSYENIRTQK